MTGNGDKTVTLGGSVRKVLNTALGSIQNRSELFVLEMREEGMRAVEILFWAAAVLFAGLGIILLTGLVIFLFREDLRVYAAGGLQFYISPAASGL